jgi:hypothetical protein
MIDACPEHAAAESAEHDREMPAGSTGTDCEDKSAAYGGDALQRTAHYPSVSATDDPDQDDPGDDDPMPIAAECSADLRTHETLAKMQDAPILGVW